MCIAYSFGVSFNFSSLSILHHTWRRKKCDAKKSSTKTRTEREKKRWILSNQWHRAHLPILTYYLPDRLYIFAKMYARIKVNLPTRSDRIESTLQPKIWYEFVSFEPMTIHQCVHHGTSCVFFSGNVHRILLFQIAQHILIFLSKSKEHVDMIHTYTFSI